MKKAVPAVYRPSPSQVLQEDLLKKSRLKPDGDSAMISLQIRWNQRKPRASPFAEHILQDTPPVSSAQESSSWIPAPTWSRKNKPRGSIPCFLQGCCPSDSPGWSGCHHSNFHQELTMHPNELRAKLTYCMSPVRNDCSEVIFCTNM